MSNQPSRRASTACTTGRPSEHETGRDSRGGAASTDRRDRRERAGRARGPGLRRWSRVAFHPQCWATWTASATLRPSGVPVHKHRRTGWRRCCSRSAAAAERLRDCADAAAAAATQRRRPTYEPRSARRGGRDVVSCAPTAGPARRRRRRRGRMLGHPAGTRCWGFWRLASHAWPPAAGRATSFRASRTRMPRSGAAGPRGAAASGSERASPTDELQESWKDRQPPHRPIREPGSGDRRSAAPQPLRQRPSGRAHGDSRLDVRGALGESARGSASPGAVSAGTPLASIRKAGNGAPNRVSRGAGVSRSRRPPDPRGARRNARRRGREPRTVRTLAQAARQGIRRVRRHRPSPAPSGRRLGALRRRRARTRPRRGAD